MKMTTELTPTQKIQAAYLHHIVGLTQMQIAIVLNISNHGRINEAIKHVEEAVGLSEGGYKDNHRPKLVGDQ